MGTPAGTLEELFAGFPLRAVPWVLGGHREIAPVDGDDKVEARVVWRHLQLAPWLLRRPSQPGRSWAERPAAMMLEVLRFYLEGPRERWEEHAPPTGKGFPRRQRPGGTAHPPAQGS